jgi:hypothetical protein
LHHGLINRFLVRYWRLNASGCRNPNDCFKLWDFYSFRSRYIQVFPGSYEQTMRLHYRWRSCHRDKHAHKFVTACYWRATNTATHTQNQRHQTKDHQHFRRWCVRTQNFISTQ